MLIGGTTDMNKLFLVSGHSGSGKSSIMKTVMKNEVVSFTTREKRQGEVDGKDYIFITLDEFNKLKDDNRLVEYVEYSGNMYGITKDELENKLNKDHAFCIVDYHGMNQLKKFYPNVTTIFLYTSYEDAMIQMLNRGDPADRVLERMSTYKEEMSNRIDYDYIIKNNYKQMNNTIQIIYNIIESEIGANKLRWLLQ